jgi:hypothetical protein
MKFLVHGTHETNLCSQKTSFFHQFPEHLVAVARLQRSNQYRNTLAHSCKLCIINEQLHHLSYSVSVSNCKDRVVLVSALRHVNQYQYVTR